MYYPYLRGKQFELLALRDFANSASGVNDNVFPIIEPVRSTFNGIRLAIPILRKGNVRFAIVLNPQVGDLENDDETVWKELQDFHGDFSPAFIVNRNANRILTRIQEDSLSDVILICPPEAVDVDETLESLAANEAIRAIVIGDKFKRLKHKMARSGKDVVVMYDNFIPKAKNSAYASGAEELFSEDYYYYQADGYQGIADYTVLPSVFTEGGRLPSAIAIHLTYDKDESIYVRHFVSDSNDGTANIQGKFAEAAQKAINFFDALGVCDNAINMLKYYYNNGDYPGLGMLKKISILHHLELVSNALRAQRNETV